MNYQKHKWVTREVIREQYLNHIEDGIYNEEFRARTAEDYLQEQIENEAERAINAESTINTNISGIQTNITSLQNAVNVINGGIAVPGSMDYKIQAALSEANGSLIVPSLADVTEPDPSRLYFVEDSTTHLYNGYMWYNDGTTISWVCVTTSSGGGSSSLADLTDTAISSPSSGQILSFNGTAWTNTAAPSGDLAGLTDTTISNPSNGQMLKYDGTKWVNDAVPSGSLSGLTDTTISSATNGQILKYNGSTWVNDAAPSGDLAGLTDTNITSVADKQILQYDSTSSKWVNTTQKVMLSQTLTAGNTSVTFSSGIPSGDYEVWVLTSKIGLDYVTMTGSASSITVTFDAQSDNVTVYLEFRPI